MALQVKSRETGEPTKALTSSTAHLLFCWPVCYSGQTEHFHFWSPNVRIHQATGFLFCTRSA